MGTPSQYQCLKQTDGDHTWILPISSSANESLRQLQSNDTTRGNHKRSLEPPDLLEGPQHDRREGDTTDAKVNTGRDHGGNASHHLLNTVSKKRRSRRDNRYKAHAVSGRSALHLPAQPAHGDSGASTMREEVCTQRPFRETLSDINRVNESLAVRDTVDSEFFLI